MQRLVCIHILCGMTLLFLTGCYHSTPYGYNGYPGVYTVPPTGGNYVPQGAIILPPTNVDPNGSGTFQQDQWSPTQVSPTPADDVPVYDGSDSDPSVPDYSEPDTDFSDPGNFNNNQPSNDPPMGDFSFNAPPKSTPRLVHSASPTQIQMTGASNQFLPPIIAISDPAVHTTVQIKGNSQNQPNPCAYDKRHFRWLLGLADYNSEDGTWNLIYNLQPDQSDPYGGSFQLVSDDRLNSLKAQAQQEKMVLLVEGYIDSKVPDQNGKPSYRIEHLSRLRRKSN